MDRSHRIAARLGFSGVGLFALALVIFGLLNPDFDALEDHVSKLGAKGQPLALWWNLIGFLSVGVLLAAFGFAFGRVIGDRLVGGLLVLFGFGFASTSIPIEFEDEASAISKAHIVSICLGLAAWLLAVARMAQIKRLGASVHRVANVAAGLFFLPILGQLAGLWPMPVAHRLVFTVVFGWFVVTSLRLWGGDSREPRAGDNASRLSNQAS